LQKRVMLGLYWDFVAPEMLCNSRCLMAYMTILTDELASELSENFQDSEYTVGPLDAASATRRLADSLADQLAGLLQEIGSVCAGDADPDSKVSQL